MARGDTPTPIPEETSTDKLGKMIEEETGEKFIPAEVDIDVSEFDESPVEKPATDVVGVQRMLENMFDNNELQSAILRVGMERYKDGDSLTPKQQGHMEMARRMFKDGITTPNQVDSWLAEQQGQEGAEGDSETETESAEQKIIADYRQLEPGSPEEIAANTAILTDLLQEADVPNGEKHAAELRAALRTQVSLTDDDAELLKNLRGVVEKKARSLRTGETDETTIEMVEIGSDHIASYDSIKDMAEGPDKRAATEQLLKDLLPKDAQTWPFIGALETLMKGDTSTEDALKAVQKQFRNFGNR